MIEVALPKIKHHWNFITAIRFLRKFFNVPQLSLQIPTYTWHVADVLKWFELEKRETWIVEKSDRFIARKFWYSCLKVKLMHTFCPLQWGSQVLFALLNADLSPSKSYPMPNNKQTGCTSQCSPSLQYGLGRVSVDLMVWGGQISHSISDTLGTSSSRLRRPAGIGVYSSLCQALLYDPLGAHSSA